MDGNTSTARPASPKTTRAKKNSAASTKAPSRSSTPKKKASKQLDAPAAKVTAKAKSGTDGRAPKPARPPKQVKTRLNDTELAEFRELLLAKRRELVGDVTQLESQAMRQGGSEGGGSSTMPIHMADLGSDTWEQELTLGLIANERGLLREIDESLERIDARTYGVCVATNKPITKSRLRAKPWAKYCIEYARKLEMGLV